MGLNYHIFTKKLIVFTLILAAIVYAITYFLPEAYITPTLPFQFVFFFAATMVIHYILLRASQRRAARFINFFMLLTFGKLIFFLSIILAYALIFREDAIQFVITFFILYVFFTAFEINQSLRFNRESEGSAEKGKQG